MKRHEIWYARLEPVEGSEIGKTRPCVIVSLNVMNAVFPSCLNILHNSFAHRTRS